jgi:hypothetical protein
MFTFRPDISVVWLRGLDRSWSFWWMAAAGVYSPGFAPGSGCAGLAGGVLVGGGAWRGVQVWSGWRGDAGEGGFPAAFAGSGREAGRGPAGRRHQPRLMVLLAGSLMVEKPRSALVRRA